VSALTYFIVFVISSGFRKDFETLWFGGGLMLDYNSSFSTPTGTPRAERVAGHVFCLSSLFLPNLSTYHSPLWYKAFQN